MMRITPSLPSHDTEDYESLEIIIKAIPFENTFAPVFYVSSPSDDYVMNIDELSCLMDGIDIARKSIDDIIDFLIRSKNEQQD